MPAIHAHAVVSVTAKAAGHHVTPSSADEVAVLTIDERGMIRDCNRDGERLFKYRRSEMVWQHISALLPQLADLDLMPNGQPNPRLRYFCRIGGHLQALTHDGGSFACELYFNVLDNDAGHGRLVLVVRPTEEAVSD